jgi:sec-independent protein translocase protein TatA
MGLGPADLGVIFLLALLLFGPKKLPELGKQLGHAMREMRKITDEITGATDSIKRDIDTGFKPIFSEPPPQVTAAAKALEARPLDVPADSAIVPMPDAQAGVMAARPALPETVQTGGLRISTLPPGSAAPADKGE